jgi:hypothetical protein
MPVTPYRRANLSININDFPEADGNELIIGGTAQINNFPEGAQARFKWNSGVFDTLIPANSEITGYEVNVRNKSNNGDGHKFKVLVGYDLFGNGPLFSIAQTTGFITSDSFINTSIGGEGITFGYSSGNASEWEYIKPYDLYVNLEILDTNNGDVVDFVGIPHTSEADIIDGSTFTVPSVGLRIYYDPPQPTKVKLEGIPPTEATLKGFPTPSFVQSTLEVAVDSGDLNNEELKDRLAGPNNPGIVVLTSQHDSGDPLYPSFYGGKIGINLGSINLNTGVASYPSSTIPNLSNLNSITANFLYKFNANTTNGSNSFRTGFGYGYGTNVSDFNIDFGEKIEYNNNLNENYVRLHSNTVSGTTVADNALDLLYLNFAIEYNDDNPNNQSVNIYCQSSAGELGLTSIAGTPLNNPSIEFIYNYIIEGIDYKIKLKPIETTTILTYDSDGNPTYVMSPNKIKIDTVLPT